MSHIYQLFKGYQLSIGRTLMTLIMTACVALTLSASLSAQAEDYLTHIDDIPLPAGFSEDKVNILVFTVLEGRVITQNAYGKKSPQEVESYYKSSLPALGWSLEKKAKDSKTLTFVRENEMLAVMIKSEEGRTHIQFYLSPSL